MFIDLHHANISHNNCGHTNACVVAARTYNPLHPSNITHAPNSRTLKT